MTAVVFVDVQKDFIDGALKNETAIEVTPKIVEFAKECAADLDCKLYATRDTHQKTKHNKRVETKIDDVTDPVRIVDVPVTGYLTSLEGKRLPVEHCIEMTDGWMIDNRLMEVLDGKCTFVNKPTFGSFDLAEIINEDFETDKLDEIVLCGFCTDVCVVSNALLLRAKFPNTTITVMKDLCAGVTPVTHDAALKTMQMCQIDVI